MVRETRETCSRCWKFHTPAPPLGSLGRVSAGYSVDQVGRHRPATRYGQPGLLAPHETDPQDCRGFRDTGVSSSLQGPTTRLFNSIQSGEREGITSASPAAGLCGSWRGQVEADRDHECDHSPVPSDTSDPVLLGLLWLFLRALTLVPAPASFHR